MKRRKYDEREELELLKLSKAGFWILFVGLVVAILVQIVLLKADFGQVAGETVVLMAGGIAVIAGGIRNGQEHFKIKHQLRKSVMFGLIAAVIADVIIALSLYIRSRGQENIPFKSIMVTLAVGFAVIWLLGTVAVFVTEAAAHRKRKKFDEMYCDDEEENEAEEDVMTGYFKTADDGLRKIANAGNDFELNTIEELLEGQKIPYITRDREAGAYMRVYSGATIYGTDVLVPEELYQKAYEVLDSFPWNADVLVHDDENLT